MGFNALTFFFTLAQHPRPEGKYQDEGIQTNINDTRLQQNGDHQEQEQEAVVPEVCFQPFSGSVEAKCNQQVDRHCPNQVDVVGKTLVIGSEPHEKQQQAKQSG